MKYFKEIELINLILIYEPNDLVVLSEIDAKVFKKFDNFLLVDEGVHLIDVLTVIVRILQEQTTNTSVNPVNAIVFIP